MTLLLVRLNDGGQSINILSYFCKRPFFSFQLIFLLKAKALLESLAVSTSRPDKFTCEPIISKFLISVFCITSFKSDFFYKKIVNIIFFIIIIFPSPVVALPCGSRSIIRLF